MTDKTSSEPVKLSSRSNVILPLRGLPPEVSEVLRKSVKAAGSRAVLFETDKQRNIGALKKGLQKPGLISFEVLRRASMSVAVARICVTVLKEKITKTQWVIKSVDPLAEVDQSKVDAITKLLKNPNPNDTWRSLLDKMLEDILVLDACIVEKTRYPNGELGALYYVDASTIRPVYDEFGNTDIPIEVRDPETHQVETKNVAFCQVMNNSMYGGPESGEIVATWEKKDIISIQKNPQGAMDRWGYGLSPLESVLSVVNNLLNSDNYNGSYFDEGSFPPIIMQLAGQINQRDLEAYREYMYAELEGNFHRPAIMAGGGELKIHNLKDLSNRDMQFMEYINWLSKLLCAAYGLSPQDIGLTDAVGGKNVAETQADLSAQKGYSSLLHLIKEVINQDIIVRDFGFTDMEFDWVSLDSTDPDIESKIHDLKLKNGTITINEVREADGKTPFGEWADQPALLTANGFIPLEVSDANKEGAEDVEEHTVYRNEESNVTKSQIKKAVYTPNGYKTWFDDRGVSQPFIWSDVKTGTGMVIKPPIAVNLFSQNLECQITDMLANQGLKVERVSKTPFVDIVKGFPNAELMLEFDKYITMSPDYDSEKWRAKNGGSRKFPYYLTSNFIDGFPLNSKYVIDDMKRDPDSYITVIEDLANLWVAEKEFILGDRRADQYIITPYKRAYGFDYQFMGDKKRWEDSSTSIQKVLMQVPKLANLFNEKITLKQTVDKKKSIFKTIWEKVTKGSSEEFEKTPVMFGSMFPHQDKELVRSAFKSTESESVVISLGYVEHSYTYNWDEAIKSLATIIESDPMASGGIMRIIDERGIRYAVFCKTALNKSQKVYKGTTDEFEETPVIFGSKYKGTDIDTVKTAFKNRDVEKVLSLGYTEHSYGYNWNEASTTLARFIEKNYLSSGGIIRTIDERGVKYTVWCKK